MIKIISASASDQSSYYSGCTVFDEDGMPWHVEAVEQDCFFVSDHLGSVTHIPKDDVRIHYLRPFYDKDGGIHGVQVARSYKRAPVYDKHVFPDLKGMVDGTFKSTFNGETGRIGPQFYVKKDNRVEGLLLYYNEVCGFLKDKTFFLVDEFLSARLSATIQKEGLEYVVSRIQ